MNTAVAVPAALLSALTFGVGSVLQQQAASGAPAAASLRPRLLLELVRRPRWLAGMALVVSSFALLGLALASGPLVLVQPLAATDLVFALPFLAYRRRVPLTRAEAVGILCTAGGVALFLTVLPEPAQGAVPDIADWVPVLAAVGGAVAILAPVGLRRRGTTRTALFAVCAALLFALLDSLTKSTAERFQSEGTGAFLAWEPYSLILVGVLGLTMSQSAYQAGSLAVSLPIIDTLEPIGAVLIGIAVFGERLAQSPAALAVQMLGAAVAVAGIIVLDRSPLARV